MTNRRDFLKTGAVAGGALLTGIGPALLDAGAFAAGPSPAAKLDLLILGGTGFIGPHLVRLAVSRGHRVTIFSRGRRTPDLPEGITRLTGDRNGQLGALEGKRWDAVVDDSATNPDWVKQSTALLKDPPCPSPLPPSPADYYP